MTDLIVHVGLSKAGSSTLQQSVFADERGYLGTAPGLPAAQNLGKQLQRCGPFGGRQTLNVQCLHRWAERVHSMHRERWPDVPRLIASDEVLGSRSRFESRPVVRLLGRLRGDAWPYGRVRTIVVFRNQATRLASSYAQNSWNNLQPGQGDFEAEVERKLRREMQALDYGAWVAGLERVLGRDNVCALLLEESNSSAFWKELREFAELENLDPEDRILRGNHKNVRRDSRDTWRLRSLDVSSKAKVKIDKWLNLMWPHSVLDGSRSSVRAALIKRATNRFRRRVAHLDPTKRAESITLTPEVRAKIRDHCSAGNRALAEWLGRDITHLGY